MPQESRVRKSLLNARVNLIFYFLTLALSFFSRKIFLDCLGADFIGLTGTLYNLLGFLNLAELGIGSAIGYVLYKPLFDHDQQKINEIISVMGYLYRWIGFIILGAGCLLACFLPLIFPNTGFNLSLIYFAYFSFLTSSLIGYFINYRQNLLGADQRNYVVTAYYQSALIIKTIIQMVAAYYTNNYYLWVLFELTFGIIYSFILNWKINQTYPWLKSEIKEGRKLFKKYPEVTKYSKQLFVHKISAFVQFQTAPFLVYLFVSLKIVAYYGNYTLIIDKINILISNALGGLSASIGNLIAEGNKKKIMRIYWELFAMRFLIFGVFIYGLLKNINPVIFLWLGEEYILPTSTLWIISLNIFIGMTRGLTDPFLFGFGLFRDMWAPITENIIYIIVACLCGWKMGLNGVLLGTTISTFFIIGLWKPFFLFHYGFKLAVKRFWVKWGLCTFLGLLSFFVIEHLLSAMNLIPVDSWPTLIYNATISTLLFTLTYFLSLYLFNEGMRNFVLRFIKINHHDS